VGKEERKELLENRNNGFGKEDLLNLVTTDVAKRRKLIKICKLVLPFAHCPLPVKTEE
jgi:hypothetical protein